MSRGRWASRRQAKDALHYADIGVNTDLQLTRAKRGTQEDFGRDRFDQQVRA